MKCKNKKLKIDRSPASAVTSSAFVKKYYLCSHKKVL